MRIRDYDAGDAPEIAQLFYETVRSVNRTDYSDEQVEAWAQGVPDPDEQHARIKGRRTLVAEEGDELVGFVELEGDGHLDTLYVRGDSVGRGLRAAAERATRDRGVERISTEPSITARPFFGSRGFRVAREQANSPRGMPMTNFAMEMPPTSPGGEGKQGA